MVLSILESWYIIFSLTRQMQMLRYLFYNRLPLLRCRCRMPAWLIRQLLVRLCKNCRDKRPEKQPIRKQYSISIIKVVMPFCLITSFLPYSLYNNYLIDFLQNFDIMLGHFSKINMNSVRTFFVRVSFRFFVWHYFTRHRCLMWVWRIRHFDLELFYKKWICT